MTQKKKTKEIKRAYFYRLNPSKEQSERMFVWTAAARFIYNWFLGQRISWYQSGAKDIPKLERDIECDPNSFYRQSSQIKNLNKYYPFLRDTPFVVLQQSAKIMDGAFKDFFKHHKGFPKFRSFCKHESMHFTEKTFSLDQVNRELNIVKMKNIPVVLNRPALGRLKNLTIKNICGFWYASINVVEEIEIVEAAAGSVSVRYDIERSTIYINDKPTDRLKTAKTNRRINLSQRAFNRKKRGSNRYKKAKNRLSRSHKKLAKKRKDYLHKLSTDICKSYNKIIVVDANLSEKTRNVKRLYIKKAKRSEKLAATNKSVLSQGYHTFCTLLEYKADWRCSTFNLIK